MDKDTGIAVVHDSTAVSSLETEHTLGDGASSDLREDSNIKDKSDDSNDENGCNEAGVGKNAVSSEKNDFEEKIESCLENDEVQEIMSDCGAVFVTDQEKSLLLKTVDETEDVERTDPGVCFTDKETEDDLKKEQDLQHIEDAKEDLQLLYVAESPTNISEFQKQNEVSKETGTLLDSHESNILLATDLQKTSTQEVIQNEEIENNKFEEISEGSIDEIEQDGLDAEPFSDVEIIGEYFVPAKDQTDKGNISIHKRELNGVDNQFKDSESMERKTGSGNVNITAENKYSDDISDTSMSDHADANLSLEEISDDDLELSRRKRKSSGQTQVTAENNFMKDENITLNESDKFEKDKPDPTRTHKRPIGEDAGDSSGTSNKRLKSSNETAVSQELFSKGEKEQAFAVDAHGNSKHKEKRQQMKVQETSIRDVHSSARKLSKSSKNWRQEGTEKSLSSRDLVGFRRRYVMVDSCCQSEPQLLKGKIVQCNINPKKSDSETERQQSCANIDSTVFKLLDKFKHYFPSSAPEKFIAEVISSLASQQGMYSFSMGPLKLSSLGSPEFRDAVFGSTDSFSLGFDNHHQGIFKGTFSTYDSILSLMKWLTRKEWDSRYMVMSVASGFGIGQTCKATVLILNEQDKCTESQVPLGDDSTEVRLFLSGLPKDVKTDFIQLLFPDAQNIVSGSETIGDRVVTLDFPSARVLEDVLTSYSLLDINGSHVSISQQNLQDPDLQKGDESQAETGKEAECAEQSDLHDRELVSCGQTADYDTRQKQSEPQVGCEDKTQLSCTVLNDISDNIGSEPSLGNSDLSAAVSAQDSESISKEKSSHSTVPGTADVTHADDHSREAILLKDKGTETVDDVSKRQGNKEEITELVSENAAHSAGLGEDEIGDKSFTLVPCEEDCSLGASAQSNTRCETKLPTEKDISAAECMEDTQFNSERNVSAEDKDGETADHQTVHTVMIREGTQASDGNLEDVSDEEVVNHNKPNDESKSSANNTSLKDAGSKDHAKCLELIQEGNQKSDSQTKNGGDTSGSDGRQLDSKLVMTDGSLEISMEVIDVDGGDDIGKVIYPHAWREYQDRPSYSNKLTRYDVQHDVYRGSPAEEYVSGTSGHQYSRSSRVRESTLQRRDSFMRKDRTSSGENWNKRYDGRQPGTYADSRSTESKGRPGESAYHSGYDNKLAAKKPEGQVSHRDPQYTDRRRSSSRSLSVVSVSLEDQALAANRSPNTRRDLKEPSHTSRSPISISSKSCSLSPVSRSPSPDLTKTGLEDKELVKTVQHFLKLARGIQQTQKRHHIRRKMSSHHSRSPAPLRSRSPHMTGNSRFLHSRSSHAKRSRSPQPGWSRNSKSPTFIKSSRYRNERSLSPVSSVNDGKRYRGDHSLPDRRDPYSRGHDSPSYSKSRSYRSGDYSRTYEEHVGRSKPAQWPAPKCSDHYRSNDQPWQQSYGGYQSSQNCGPPPTSNIYNPNYPPPGCPPQEVQTGLYPSSSMPLYQYGNQSQYNYSNIPPSVPTAYNVPPPNSIAQPYQPPYPMYQPPHF